MLTEIGSGLTWRALLAACLLSSSAGTILAQADERWYQVEVAIFTHEYADRQAEIWPQPPEHPGQTERAGQQGLALQSWLEWLSLDAWTQASQAQSPDAFSLSIVDPLPASENPELALAAPPPLPPIQQQTSLRLPDESRQAYFRLSESEWQFSESLRRLEQSPGYRLLYHAAWRQPMPDRAQARGIRIQGGHHLGMDGALQELEGELLLYFNPSRDRVMLDSRLWLNALEGNNELLRIPLTQLRDMRSNEFHYLDHPVAGIIAQVFSHEPPPPLPDTRLLLPGSDLSPTQLPETAVSE